MSGDSLRPRFRTCSRRPSSDWCVTWDGSRFGLYNQVRVLRYLSGGQGPITEFQGATVQVHHVSLTVDEGIRIDCAGGPLWVTCTPVA